MAKLFPRQPLSSSLSLNIPSAVLNIFHTFTQKGYDIWLVGGGVRNFLSKKPIIDPDFTTNATPKQIQQLFPDSFYDNAFGTVGLAVEIDDQKQVFEFTTYRTEASYTDRRHPDKVKWGKTLEEDLSRRDFTINSVVIGPDHQKPKALPRRQAGKSQKLVFVDPFSGINDLSKKIIRAVGDPKKRFEEDALRMMRAIRIASQLKFMIEAKTLKAIQQSAHLLTHISRERIHDELIKILSSDYPADGVLLLHSSRLLEHIIPELLEARGVKQIGHHIYDVWTHSIESLRHCPSTDPIVRFATLLHDIGKPKTAKPRDGKEVTFYGHEVVGSRLAKTIANRLRFSKKDTEKIFTLVRWHMFAYDPKMTDAAIRRFIRRVGIDNINDMLMLRVGDRKGGGSKATSWRLRELQERVGTQLYEPLTVKDLKINGHDIMKTLKIKPGPKIGKILNTLFEEIIEDTRKNTKDYLLKRAKELNKDQ